jgi:hypothetical protein
MATQSEISTVDFSGAPPLLIPRSLAASWRGTTDPLTGGYRELDLSDPVTDYDRACAAAWPGREILDFMGTQILALYTEFDLHAWDANRQVLACGGWFPSDNELSRATWTDPIRWRAEHKDYLLMNAAADAWDGLLDADYILVQLRPGVYTVDYGRITSKYVGCFHRFIRD